MQTITLSNNTSYAAVLCVIEDSQGGYRGMWAQSEPGEYGGVPEPGLCSGGWPKRTVREARAVLARWFKMYPEDIPLLPMNAIGDYRIKRWGGVIRRAVAAQAKYAK